MLVIAVNNLRLVVRQPIMLFTTLVLPFAIITIVGIALGSSPNQVTVGIVANTAADPLGQKLVAGIEAAPALHTTVYATDADLDRAVRRGEVVAGVIVPSGYGADLLSGQSTQLQFVTTPNQSTATTARAVISSVISNQVIAVQAGVFSSTQTGRSATTEIARAATLQSQVVTPTVTEDSVASPSSLSLGFNYTGPANLTLFIVITSLTSASALVLTRLSGVTRRMYVMPMARSTVLLGEFLGRFITAAAQALVIIGFCALVFQVHWGDPWAVALLTATLCTFGAVLGMLVGFVGKSTAQVVAFGPPIGVALGMLGGCMWPLDITGSIMTKIGHVTPHAWAMDGYIRLINHAGGVAATLPDIGIILGMTAIFAGLAAGAARRDRTA